MSYQRKSWQEKLNDDKGLPKVVEITEKMSRKWGKETEWMVKEKKLERENMVMSIRSSFRDKTSRRILFYRNMEDLAKETPDMAVYYMGIPDTSPEVLSEKEMDNYFEKALERVKK